MAQQTLTFNRQHKNGWLSWRLQGVRGAVFIDKRMLSPETLANPPQTINVEVPGMVEAGADVSEAQAAKLAKKQELETKKAERAQLAATKATARLEKLQQQAAKAQERAEAAKAKSVGGAPAAGPEAAAEGTAEQLAQM